MGWQGALLHVTGYQIQRTGGGIDAHTGALSDPDDRIPNALVLGVRATLVF